jgi:heparan-alpha-glucosaminide N-acetyltransferase
MGSSTKVRLKSLDIIRGLNLFLMLFVNDLFEPGVPRWLLHAEKNYDGMGLADIVFPCFLVLVGLSIPFAFAKRFQTESTFKISKHILIRTFSLLIIGVFMVNIGEYNEQLSGLNKYVWILAGSISVFLIWNNYPDNRTLFKILRVLGIIVFIAVFIIYRTGTVDDMIYIKTRWWGILGLIGWGYLVAAFFYLIFRDHILPIAITFLFFIGLNCLSQLKLLLFLHEIRPLFGVIMSGIVPSMVLGGLILGILLRKYANQPIQFLKIAIPYGIVSIVVGFVFRHWFIISKDRGTPSWGLICLGISVLAFALIFYIVEIKNHSAWANVFVPAGKNSLTTYLYPDIIYYISWAFSLPLFLYKQNSSQLLAVAGSLLWAFVMIRLTPFLVKKHIQLKL